MSQTDHTGTQSSKRPSSSEKMSDFTVQLENPKAQFAALKKKMDTLLIEALYEEEAERGRGVASILEVLPVEISNPGAAALVEGLTLLVHTSERRNVDVSMLKKRPTTLSELPASILRFSPTLLSGLRETLLFNEEAFLWPSWAMYHRCFSEVFKEPGLESGKKAWDLLALAWQDCEQNWDSYAYALLCCSDTVIRNTLSPELLGKTSLPVASLLAGKDRAFQLMLVQQQPHLDLVRQYGLTEDEVGAFFAEQERQGLRYYVRSIAHGKSGKPKISSTTGIAPHWENLLTFSLADNSRTFDQRLAAHAQMLQVLLNTENIQKLIRITSRRNYST